MNQDTVLKRMIGKIVPFEERPKGRFKHIIVDGPDGCGKSSVASALCELLPNSTLRVEPQKEPGTTGYEIRNSLQFHQNNDPKQARLLFQQFTKDRFEHNIQEHLAYSHVIQDRGYLSSSVYQAGLYWSWQELLFIQRMLFEPPSLYVVLMPYADVCWSRVQERGGQDRHDPQDKADFIAMHHRWLEMKLKSQRPDLKELFRFIHFISPSESATPLRIAGDILSELKNEWF